MKKKGFTIIELLVVIALIGLITTIVSYSVITLSDKSKKNLYDSKIDFALTQAKNYGETIINSLSNNCTNVTIGSLVSNGFIESERVTSGVKEIVDPRTNTSMNDTIICIRYVDLEIITSIEGE